MAELEQLRADHAPAVLAFDQFPDRHSASLAEQEAGTCAFYVLVADDGSVLGRFNLYDFTGGTASSPAAAWRPGRSGSCAGSRRRGTGCCRVRPGWPRWPG